MRLWRRLTGAGLTCRVLLYTSDSMLIVAHSQLLRAAPGSQQQVHSFLIGRSLCASIRSLCLRTPHTAPRHVFHPIALYLCCRYPRHCPSSSARPF